MSASSRWNSFVYAFSVTCRLFMVLSNGMIHPDEYFQSQEVMATDVFSLKNTFIPWEWDRKSPNRSVFFPGLIAGLPYLVLRSLHFSLSDKSLGLLLLYIPRFLLFFLSLIIDQLIVSISRALGKDPRGPVLTFSTSWTVLLFFVRPFSNTAEAMVLILSFYALLCGKASNRRNVQLGCLLACGTFIRFTFVLFFLPLGFYLVYDNDQFVSLAFSKRHDRKSSGNRIKHLCRTLIGGFCGFLLTSMAIVVVDTLYFRWDEIDITNPSTIRWVVSPWNNLMYNMDPTNLAEHGLHPRYVHFISNMPMLFGPLALLGFVRLAFSGRMKLSGKGTVLLTTSVLFPLCCLSMAPHQEPRFILPLIAPLVLLLGDRFFGASGTLSAQIIWLVFNAILTLFFGFFHQAGIIPVLSALNGRSTQPIHVVFFHTYMVPRMIVPCQEGCLVDVIDLSGASLSKLQDTVLELDGETFVVAPGTVEIPSKFVHDISFWPHISTEELPQSWKELQNNATLVVYRISN